MKKTLITSISLPEAQAALWRSNKRDIMQFAERYLTGTARRRDSASRRLGGAPARLMITQHP